MSSHLLLNKRLGHIEDREQQIRQMFIETDNTLLDPDLRITFIQGIRSIVASNANFNYLN